MFCAKLVGDGYDVPVGTCVVSPLGASNTWIGMILVHPELRRQGLATAMMRHCIQYAVDAGKVINGLDATPMGSTVYVNVGYVGTFRIWCSIFQTEEFAQASPSRARPIGQAELEEVISYDSTCFMARPNVLRCCTPTARARPTTTPAMTARSPATPSAGRGGYALSWGR